MQVHSNFLNLCQNLFVNQNFVLSNIEEFELHNCWLSILWVALITISNVLHAADEIIRDQIVVYDNSRFLETYEPEL